MGAVAHLHGATRAEDIWTTAGAVLGGVHCARSIRTVSATEGSLAQFLKAVPEVGHVAVGSQHPLWRDDELKSMSPK